MNIEIICPVYNAEKYILKLNESLIKQKNVEVKKISYILTESTDRTEEMLKQINADYTIIEKKNFSHSLVRENAAKKSNADIIVFISQDIEIKNDDWLEKLVSPIINNEAEACYSRQISNKKNIEKYIREKNYPKESFIKTKENIKKMKLNTFFFSDASSAIKSEIFRQLNFYDGKNMLTNEDMYLAYKLIMNDYRIKYCADSIVYHSHNLSLKQTYERYYNYGKFMKENSFLLEYDINNAGKSLAFYVLKSATRACDIKTLLCFIPNMSARYFGRKIGGHN